MSDIEKHSYDVLVIGAGGAGLRAAIEARLAGKKTAIISKSLFGKAHTVMAEGGAAAAMGNVNSNDNWMVHFRDTMRGGKFLNNFRMAELHAREAPDRIWELETYGALFDRTKDGRISQRNFGGHEYPRLAHVGDRTGLELIRTLQQKIVSLQQEDGGEDGIRVFAECTITDTLLDGNRVAGAVGYYRDSGEFVVFEARAINSEIKAGRGSPAGGVYLDIASRRSADFIHKRLPSMYHQFKELADVDITKQPMEIGPTCHYVMGGVEVDPDTGAAAGTVEGLFAAGEVSGGMHGSNRLGGNSLSDLLVFGKRAGEYAALYVDRLGSRPAAPAAAVDAAVEAALAPLVRENGENPFDVWSDLQQVMQDLVGIIRRKSELEESLKLLVDLKERIGKVSAPGGRRFNPGWHLAIDLRNMVLVSECTARAALEREESRGGHTREDFPQMDAKWRQVNLVCSVGQAGEVELVRKPVPTIRPELLALFERSELKKYMTDEELAMLGDASAESTGRPGQPAKDGE